MKKLLLMLLGVLMALPAFARDFSYTHDGQTLTYTVIDEEAKTCMTKEGSRPDWNTMNPGNRVSGDLVIPSVAIDGNVEYTVTKIPDHAFIKCKLTSVKLPQTLTSIGKEAFLYTWIETIEFPESLTSIGSDAFGYCPLTSLEIPESVIEWGEGPFFGCSSVESIEIPSSWTHIPDGMFNCMSGLTSVVIPESVTTIGRSAFAQCGSLEYIEIPKSVTTIGANLFSSCKSLTSVVIPETITSIPSGTFNGCSSLKSIEIPESVTSIGRSAFKDCSGLTSIEIPESVTSIESEAFKGCSNLTSANLPNSLKTIMSSLFDNCNSLASIVIPRSVTKIESYAFRDCSTLDVVIPSSVEKIESYAFTNVYSVTIEENPSWAVASGLRYATIKELGCSYNTLLKYDATLNGCAEVIFFDTLKDLIAARSSDAVSKDKTIFKGKIDNISYKSESANEPYNLIVKRFESDELTIHNKIEDSGVTFRILVPDGMFANRSNLKSIAWNRPEIRMNEFYHDLSLKSFVIGEDVDTIAGGAFCETALERITSHSMIPPKVDATAFDYGKDDEWPYLMVPAASVEAYKAHLVWGNFRIIADESVHELGWGLKVMHGTTDKATVTSLPAKAAEWKTLALPTSLTLNGVVMTIAQIAPDALASVKIAPDTLLIPSTIVDLPAGALNGTGTVKTVIFEDGTEPITIADELGAMWKSLTSLTLGRNVKPVGDISVFKNTSSKFTDLTVTDAVTELPAKAFAGTRNLRGNVSLGKNLAKIGNQAFSNCVYLGNTNPVVLPGSLKEIGDSAFASCTRMKRIDFNSKLDRIGCAAFQNCNKIDTLRFETKTLEQHAFDKCTSLKSIVGTAETINRYAFEGLSSINGIDLHTNTVDSLAFSIADSPADTLRTLRIHSLGNLMVWPTAFTNLHPTDEITIEGAGQLGYFDRIVRGPIFTSDSKEPVKEVNLDVTTIYNFGIMAMDSLRFGNRVEYIQNAFSSKTINSLEFGTGLRSVNGFNSSGPFSEIVFPDGPEASPVLEINGFTGCKSLKKVSFGNRTKKVSGLSSSIEELDLGTSIEEYSSEDLTLKKLVIPASLNIFSKANVNCDSIIIEDRDEALTMQVRISSDYAYIGREFAGYDDYYSNYSISNVYYSDNRDLNINRVRLGKESTYVGGSVKNLYAACSSGGTTGPSSSDYTKNLTLGEGIETITKVYMYPQESLTIPSTVRSISNNCFSVFSLWDAQGRDVISKLIFADGVDEVSIGKNLFHYLYTVIVESIDIKEIYLGRNVKYSVNEADGPLAVNFPGLEKVIVGNSIRNLNGLTFKDCHRLKNVIVSDSLENIGTRAFQNCDSLRVLSLSENIKSIGGMAYDGCSSLERIVARSIVPATGNDVGFDDRTYDEIPLFVPDGTIDAYADADLWWQFANIEDHSGNVVRKVTYEEDPGFADLVPGDSIRVNVAVSYEAPDSLQRMPRRARAMAKAPAAPEFYWFSTNPAAASVTQDGMVTVHTEDPVEIWAYVLDGSDKKAVIGINTPAMKGDVNNDKIISMSDVNIIISHINAPEGSTLKLSVADVNEDGEISMSDVNILIEQIVEKQ